MSRRYALRDDQWERIKDFLPGREGHVGGTATDNRLFVDAVLYRYRAGVPSGRPRTYGAKGGKCRILRARAGWISNNRTGCIACENSCLMLVSGQ